MSGLPPVTHLLYLHGFRSSPRSAKARQTKAWLAAHRPEVRWWCPQLAASPAEAMATVEAGIAAWPGDAMAVVGSSLGGYYATWIAARRGCRGVLLNPAVDPARDLAAMIDRKTTTWHGDEPFEFKAGYIAELRALAAPAPLDEPERILAVIAEGDELLSWHEMSERYAGSPQIVLPGGDHALSDYPRLLPRAMAFLGLEP